MIRQDMTKHNDYMMLALNEAKKAYLLGEVPIGCVIVYKGKIISHVHNRTEKKLLLTEHCEIIGVQNAISIIGKYEIMKCDMYVTLEPCISCAEYIKKIKLQRIFFGAYQCQHHTFHYSSSSQCVFGGIAYKESSYLIKKFFTRVRRKKKDNTIEYC